MRIALNGMGADTGLMSQWCKSWSSLTDPASAALSMALCLPGDVPKAYNTLTTDAANLYDQLQYGSVPTVSQLPGPPQANAPQTQTQMTVPGAFTPEMSTVTPDQWAQWSQDQRDAISAMIASGAYNPEGNLPLNVLDLSKYWPYMLAGVLLLIVAVNR